jgi:class 3 adenylate cyclase/tetratricopeptide (TPR) repeat protein
MHSCTFGVCSSAEPPPYTSPVREERKVVTSLFADVVGSTALAERLDPEDFKAIVDGAIERMIRSVEEFGGSIVKLAGDGVLALFGSPAAHEDDPERAVLAGLRIAELIDEFADEVAARWAVEGLAVRVGIETGLVVLGTVGAGGTVHHDAIGDPVNTAARLQAAADPGSVVVGEVTQRLVEPRFDWSEPSSLDLKGKARPVVAYVARTARPLATRRRSLFEARLVGREHELAVAAEAVEQVRAGSGAVLLVIGDAGIGKTRLLAETRTLLEGPAGDGSLWLEARCSSYAEALPYWPFQVLLREWLGGESEQRPLLTMLTERLDGLLGADASEVRPFFASILGLPPDAEDQGLLERISGEAMQRRTVEAFRRFFMELARDQPVSVALEDFHWADPSSVQLAEELLTVTEEAAVLLIVASRPERDHPSWRIKEVVARELPHRVREVSLGALAESSDRDLLASLVGEGTVPVDLESEMLARAEGNPLYIEELTRSLIDAGALVREEAGWRFDAGVNVAVPDTIDKIVLSRIDRLAGEDREVLDAASVLGRQFSLPLLEAVADRDTATALRQLQRLDLVREGRRWPNPEYRFKHSLIQESAYRSLLKRRRQELHGRAAAALEALFAGRLEEQLGLLAHHHKEAGEPARALEYATRAAASAHRIFALQETIRQCGTALEAAADLGLDESDGRVTALLLRRGVACHQRGEYPAAIRDFEAALRGARASGDRQSEMLVLNELGFTQRGSDYREAVGLHESALAIAESIGDPGGQVTALNRLSLINSNTLHLDDALQQADRALATARQSGDDESLARALDCRKLALLQLGELEELEHVCGELIEIQKRRGDLWYLQWALLESAFVPIARADWRLAETRLAEADDVNTQIGDRATRAVVSDAYVRLERGRGDYGAALRAARDSAAHAKAAFQEWRAWSAATVGWVLLDLRAADEAIPVLEEGVLIAEEVGAPAQRLRCLSLLASARALRGEVDLDLPERVERLLDEVSTPPGGAWLFGAHVYEATARALLSSGQPERARRLVEPLVAVSQRVGWKHVEANCAVLLGRCLVALGRSPEADSLIRRGLEVALAARLALPALEARLAIGDGHDDAARELAEQIAATVPDENLRRGFLDSVRSGLG